MTSTRRGTHRPPTTRERLLEAAVDRAVHDGTNALSLQSIAARAEVSKALLLYHFRDKDDVLAALVGWLTSRLIAREQGALEGASPYAVLETLWSWYESEMVRGEVRVLIELGGERGERTRAAVRSCNERRHEVAASTMKRVFELLRLTPRVPMEMLAAAELAMREGLVLDAARDPSRTVRAAFDVFWLGALRLAQ